jgi:hypothetical protein
MRPNTFTEFTSTARDLVERLPDSPEIAEAIERLAAERSGVEEPTLGREVG